jgi:methionyl-tRNA synthetase
MGGVMDEANYSQRLFALNERQKESIRDLRKEVDDLHSEAGDLRAQLSDYRTFLRRINNWLRNNPDWDLNNEPPWYAEMQRLMKD